MEEGGEWIVRVHFYCPEDTILDAASRDKVHYEIWADQGFLTPTPGNFIDFNFVKRDVIEDFKKYDLREVAYDPAGASMLAGQLKEEEGIETVEVRQGARTFSEPMKDIEKKILAHKINHGGNPLLRWCADNLVVVFDANENIRPAKDKATGRIDGFVAMLNAWTRAIHLKPNVYESRGVLLFE